VQDENQEGKGKPYLEYLKKQIFEKSRGMKMEDFAPNYSFFQWS
jgi:hypothetical protein